MDGKLRISCAHTDAHFLKANQIRVKAEFNSNPAKVLMEKKGKRSRSTSPSPKSRATSPSSKSRSTSPAPKSRGTSPRPKLKAGQVKSGNIVVDKETLQKYARGKVKYNTKNVEHKGLRKTLLETQDKIIDSATRTAITEVLLPQESGFIEAENNDKIFKLRQKDIAPHIDMNTAKNAIDLQLTKFGPYSVNYSRNGRYLLFGGSQGHIAVMDCLRATVGTEIQLQEEVHDVQYLHNESMFAVAQNKYTFIYDHRGVEIHCMKNHERPLRLDYLPYHYLLTSVGHSGWIKWQDVSIGEYVAGFQTGHGPSRVLRHNPRNGVSHVGHSNGVVSLWSPAAGKALVSMFCHKAPVTDLAIDREGRYLVTGGLDSYMKVWDLRMFKNLHSYKTDHPVTSLDISDRGLIGMGCGRTVQVLKDAFISPTNVTYLKHTIRTPNAALCSGGGAVAARHALASSVAVHSVRFRPLEDVLCAGHTHGITTIIVPGAGEPNYDSFENDPFMNPRQRQEREVQTLLNKLSPQMIALDASFIGSVGKNPELVEAEHREIFKVANKNELDKKATNKMRGRNKISAKLRRKQKNVMDAQVVKLREKLQENKDALEKKNKPVSTTNDNTYDPLSRLASKS